MQSLIDKLSDGDLNHKARAEWSADTAELVQLYGKDCQIDGTCGCGLPMIRFDHVEYDGEYGSKEPFYQCLRGHERGNI
jgi:hypothetical protein